MQPYEKNFHFIGIGGIGMSALARILIEKKCCVSGSDLKRGKMIEALEEMGAKVRCPQSEDNICTGDVVIYSSAVKPDNVEYVAAQKKGCELWHRSDLLAYLSRGARTFAITGTHGKTSATAMMVHLFQVVGLDPSFAIGGEFKGVNGYSGPGEHFILEADESDGSLLKYTPQGILLTSLDWDHVDHYATHAELLKTMQAFVDKLLPSETLIYCGDDPYSSQLNLSGFSYGFSEGVDGRIFNFKQEGWETSFDLSFKGKIYSNVRVLNPGRHQALNAAGVFLFALSQGIDEEKIREALSTFPGVKRRTEVKYASETLLVLDDYAHHPQEVETTLKGIKEAVKERRLIALFQPHRFSRTHTFLDEFAKAFEPADEVWITDIYSAGEENFLGIHAQDLVQKIKEKSSVPVHYVSQDQWESKAKSALRPFDVLVTMGAGSITQFHIEFPFPFEPKPWKIALFFGGESTEHEISLVTARFLKEALEGLGCALVLIPVGKRGGWLTDARAAYQYLMGESSSSHFKSPLEVGTLSILAEVDLAFPCFHGPKGEDGTFHAFLDVLGIPCIGTSVLSGAVCMHKETAKRLALSAGVSTPKWLSFYARSWKTEQNTCLERIEKTLSYPLFVKPMRLGSSIGISKVTDKTVLKEAMDAAFKVECEVLVEEGIQGAREVEFPILGNQGGFGIRVPIPGEKLSGGEFVDYQKKYTPGSMTSTEYPEFTEEELQSGQEAARTLYSVFKCQGFTRIDFLLDKKGTWWFFDANPIPGMNPLSLFPKVWKREGLSQSELGKQFLLLGLEKAREEQRYLLAPLLQ